MHQSSMFFANVYVCDFLCGRITSSTAMNQKSSRSHAIFTFVVEGTGVIPSGSPAHSPSRWNGNGDPAAASSSVSTCGKLNLVDLAGSERIYKVV